MAAEVDDAREEQDEEYASHKGKFRHEPAVVGLVKVKGRGGVHLDQQRCVIRCQLDRGLVSPEETRHEVK